MANGAAGAKGQTIGGILGAGIGSVVPGVGTAVGSQVGQGIGGLIGSRIDRNAADRATPGLVDPFEQARLNELNQIRKSISTGSDVVTQSAIDQARNVGAQTQQSIARVTGGDVGSTIAGINRAQQGTQAATNQAVAQGQARLPFFENLSQQLGTRISQRKLELGLLDRGQRLAEGAQAGKDAILNLNSALALQGSVPGGPQDLLGETLTNVGQGIGQGLQNIFQGLGNRNQDAPFAGTVNPPPTLPGSRAPLDVGQPQGNQFIPATGFVSPAQQAGLGTGGVGAPPVDPGQVVPPLPISGGSGAGSVAPPPGFNPLDPTGFFSNQ